MANTAEQAAQRSSVSFGRLFWTSLPSVPWKGFVLGLFLPLVTLQVCKAFGVPLVGVGLAIGGCTLFFIVDFVKTRRPSPFAIITLLMFTTKSGAGVAAAHWPDHAMALKLATVVDEGILALLFFFSLATSYPLIFLFLDKHTLDRIPEKIRRSSHHLAAWKLATLLWAILYAMQAGVLAWLTYCEIEGRDLIEFVFGWPIVAVFLVMSVMLPRWYWTKHMTAIEREPAADFKA
jgi:hypothetical protein